MCLHALTKGVGGEISLSLEDDYAKHCLSGAIVICCQHRDQFCVSRGFRSATLTPLQFQICLSQLLSCSLVYRSLTSCGSIRGGHLSTTTTLSWGKEHHGFETFPMHGAGAGLWSGAVWRWRATWEAGSATWCRYPTDIGTSCTPATPPVFSDKVTGNEKQLRQRKGENCFHILKSTVQSIQLIIYG